MDARRWRTVAMIVLTIAVAYYFFRGPYWPLRKRLWDYAVFASAAELWVKGQNPYDNDLVQANWSASPPGLRIERDVTWVRSNAPPSTLVVMSPFGVFGHTGGAIVYLLSTSVLLGYAAWRTARWAGVTGPTQMAFYTAGMLVTTSVIIGTASGNPVMLAAPLVLLAFERARRADGLLPGIMLGIAAAAKVQIGVPLIGLAILWKPYRRMGIVASITLAAIGAVAVGRLHLANVDWIHGLRANLADTNGVGGMNDFETLSPAKDDHLELPIPMWRLIPSRPIALAFGWSMTLLAMTGLFVVARRVTNASTAPLILAAAAGITLMPVYHRTYDAMVLLPLFAVVIARLSQPLSREDRRLWIAILVLGGFFCLPTGLDRMLMNSGNLPSLRNNRAYLAFLVTPRPWALLAINWLTIIAIAREAKSATETPHRPEKTFEQTQET